MKNATTAMTKSATAARTTAYVRSAGTGESIKARRATTATKRIMTPALTAASQLAAATAFGASTSLRARQGTRRATMVTTYRLMRASATALWRRAVIHMFKRVSKSATMATT